MVIKVDYSVSPIYINTNVSPIYIKVDYGTGGGGGAVWGDITGTLSDQLDLQAELDAKLDIPTGTTLEYIDGTGALQTFPLTLPVLQEVRNQTGGTLAAGTVVYINGATGNKPTVAKAIATGDSTSAQTLGMIQSSISNNGVGYVIVLGTCSNLDTSAYTEGDQLYLSGTVAGGVTTTKPYAPTHLVYVGIVTRSHPTLGTIEVRVQNGYEMDELHNVSAQNPSNNDGLFYNTTTSLWEKKQISTALGYTPVPTTRTLTINGTGYDLSADRSWTISTNNIYNSDGTLTGNRIVSLGGNYLAFGNTTSAFVNSPFQFSHSASNGNSLTINNISASGAGGVIIGSQSTRYIHIGISGGSYTFPVANAAFIHNPYSNLYFTGGSSSQPSTGDVIMTMFNTSKNVVVGGVTDASYKFDVQGTGRIANTLTVTKGASNYIILEASPNATSPYIQMFYSGVVDRYLSIASDVTDIVATSALLFSSDRTVGNAQSIIGLNLLATASIGSLGGTLLLNGTTNNIIRMYQRGVAYRGVMGYATGTSYFQIRTGGATDFTNGTLSTIFDSVGSVGIGGITSINSSAILQADSTTKGFLKPRMTTTERNAISTPATGLSIYNTTTNTNDYYNGTAWVSSQAAITNPVTGTFTSGQIAYADSTSSLTSSTTLAYTPTSRLLLNNSVTAASAIARGQHITSTLVAAANNDVLVGLDVAPTFTLGAFTGTTILALRVTGDTLLKGSGLTSASTALTVQNSSATTMLSISNDAANTNLILRGSNYSQIQLTQTTLNRIVSFSSSNTQAEFNSESSITDYRFNNSSGNQLLRIYTTPLPTAGGTILQVPASGQSFAPTSGSATITTIESRATINQTGGANGITRGLYVNPTLTAAADWRSIEWSNNSGWGLYGAGTANNYLNGNLLIGSTTSTGEKLQVTGTARVTGNFRIDANIRDNRDNNLIQQSASTVSSNRDIEIGNGTYGRAMITAKQFSITTGTHPSLGAYSFYFLGQDAGGTTAGSVYFKPAFPSSGNINAGDFIIDLSAGTGTGRQGRVGIGTTSPTAIVDIPASTTANATLRIRSGTAPTTPNDGDIWFDGTDLKMRIGGVTKTFTLT